MMYSPIHHGFIIEQKKLDAVALELKYIMKKARIIAGVSVGKRSLEGGLHEIDHLEKAVLELAESIGIDFGVTWGNELDLSEVGK